MPGRIRVLDDALIDQIAAGEVVERPASIVKELLENSIDAGARSVTVEIAEGGIGLVRVTDDGEGMTADDAMLAVRRHATSKLQSLDDLLAIRTLGFRGEALPSIASVSRFTLTTRTRDAIAGSRVTIVGGGIPAIEETGCAPGTTVEVRDLFHNVPARRKFLKSLVTEAAHVADACLRAALSDPELRLTLVRDTRRTREYLPVKTFAERAQVLFTERLVELEGTRDGVQVEAFLGPPESARTGAGALHLLVNRRPVRDRALARAVAFAFGSVLPPGRFPIGVVHLRIDPSEVDVNVHPQKAEVRFARGRVVLDAVTRLLAAKLGTTAWSGPQARPAQYWDSRLGLVRVEQPSGGGASGAAMLQPTDSGTELDPWGLTATLVREAAPPPIAIAASRDVHASLGAAATAAADGGPPVPSRDLIEQATGAFGSLRVLGQVRRMLIVCEGADALHVIDQHAADERVRYHRLRASHRSRSIATQRLLFPERVECSANETSLVDEARDTILALGLDCVAVGPSTVAVHAVPSLLRRAPPARLLRDVLDEIGHTGARGFGDAVDTVLATMACHGAIRAGDGLSNDECAALLRSLDEIDEFAGHCPHGRPVVLTMPFSDLERRLGR